MLSLKDQINKEEISPYSEEYDLVFKAQKDIHAFKPLSLYMKRIIKPFTSTFIEDVPM